MNFINKKIKEIYKNNIGKGISKKQLLTIKYEQTYKTNIDYNKQFLNKSLGDIFSNDISKIYKNFPAEHNKNLINQFKNDDKYFRDLFNLSFLECLKHFRGEKKIMELKGLKGIETLKDEYKDDEDYLNSLEYYIMNLETVINGRKAKNPKQ